MAVGVGEGSGVGVGVAVGVAVGKGVAVGVAVGVGVGRPATRVASREAAYASAVAWASMAVRVACSDSRRKASMASIAVLVASRSGVGPMVREGRRGWQDPAAGGYLLPKPGLHLR